MTVIQNMLPDFAISFFKFVSVGMLSAIYRGDKVQCPICQSKFSQFAPFGVKKRENVRCHRCRSLERHRLLWKYLHEKTNLFDKKSRISLLHFAPESCFYHAFANDKQINYVPCDLFPEYYNFRKGPNIAKVDITAIPFDDETFDVIICNHVLEHIENDRLAMSELLRVMRKDGWGIFQVPLDYSRLSTYEDFSITDPIERERAFMQKDHVRIYGLDYKDRLAKAGFKVKEDDYVKSISEMEIKKYRLAPDELIYFCSK
jgi:SAM-dependent methyltransferase